MRKFITLALATLLLATGPALAGTLERIKESGTLRIGYRVDAAPYSYKNSIGDPAGYMVNLCQTVGLGLEKMLGLENIRFEYITVGTDDRFDVESTGLCHGRLWQMGLWRTRFDRSSRNTRFR